MKKYIGWMSEWLEINIFPSQSSVSRMRNDLKDLENGGRKEEKKRKEREMKR